MFRSFELTNEACNALLGWPRAVYAGNGASSRATAELFLVRCALDLRAIDGLLYNQFQEMSEVDDVHV